MNKRVVLISALCALVVVIAFAGCRKPSTGERRYTLKGKVVSVEKNRRQVTVAHEEVKGFMPAMTMPFTLRDEWPLEILAPGDQITATLVVDGTHSWLEEVVITRESTDTATEAEGMAEAKAGDEVPNYALVNQDDKRIRIHDYRGKALVLTFIYTRCPIPEYCTLMSTNFAQLEQQLQQVPELYQSTHLLSVSIDPDYDTPKVLRSYGAAHTGRYAEERFEHWEFASGTKDEVKGIAQFFGLRYFQDSEQIIHGLRTVIIAPDGKVAKVYRGNEWKPDELFDDLKELLESHT